MAESYFSHDANARNDTKLLSVRLKFGAAGYGVYFMLLERMRVEEDYSQPTNYAILAFELHEQEELVKSVVEDFDLFYFNEEHTKFYSKSFNKRMEIVDAKAKARQERAKKASEKRWGNTKNKQENDVKNAKAMHKQCTSNAKRMHKQCLSITKAQLTHAKAMLSDANKIKLNKIKLNNKDNTPKKEQKTSANAKALTNTQKLENDFELLWKLYPKKQRKNDALKAYKKAIKAGATNKQIQDGIVKYKEHIKIKNMDMEFVCQGGTWFNQKRWLDELDMNPVRQVNKFNKGARVEQLPDWAKKENEVKEQPLDPAKEKALRERIAKLKTSQG